MIVDSNQACNGVQAAIAAAVMSNMAGKLANTTNFMQKQADKQLSIKTLIV